MPPTRTKWPLQRYWICAVLLTALGLLPATAADEELTLLTIEGNLLGRIESLDQSNDPSLIITTYYNLLSDQTHTDIELRRRQLSALIPDYEVAFLAADSAELAQVMFDIDLQWAAIRSIHRREFTAEVVELLNHAYETIFSLIGSEN